MSPQEDIIIEGGKVCMRKTYFLKLDTNALRHNNVTLILLFIKIQPLTKGRKEVSKFVWAIIFSSQIYLQLCINALLCN